MRFVILAFVLFAVAQAKLPWKKASPAWDGLRVTWSPNPLSTWAFDSLARESSKLGRGYTLRDNLCNTPGQKFNGIRYWYKEDPALSILYDVNGIIAGIQTSVPKSSYTPSSALKNVNLVDDGDYWTATAYFVDPQSICRLGRTPEQLKAEGTGYGLWLQMGPDPVANSVLIPMQEEEIKKTDWTFGHCFYTMGNHYWYNVRKDMSCDDFVPNCLLYNNGKLTAFCFAINVNLPSERYEHPGAKEAEMFLNPVPDCFYSDPSFNPSSTMHVYMIDSPKTSSFC